MIATFLRIIDLNKIINFLEDSVQSPYDVGNLNFLHLKYFGDHFLLVFPFICKQSYG